MKPWLMQALGVLESMAKKYLEKLSNLVVELDLGEELHTSLEIKHFFSGAALYANGTIAVTWSPVGLAFKLPQQEVETLIANRVAKPFKYFPKGHIKKRYALFEDPDLTGDNQWKAYFLKAAKQTQIIE